MLQGRGGTARIALRGGVPIVPMAIVGTQRKFWFSKRQLIIGKPYYPEVREGDPTSEKIPASEMSRLTDEIMLKMCELLPPEYHGHYREKMQSYQQGT